ncbi:unnamed protein product [Paramecium sonneborni]|uniref:Cytochrome P450 n=1 Tax=Paramecium sonneborni TaxID=65129 RepID=A0A8S1PGD1_9CILI|nr:unnamed protein product [Paramecium sonneborni]
MQKQIRDGLYILSLEYGLLFFFFAIKPLIPMIKHIQWRKKQRKNQRIKMSNSFFRICASTIKISIIDPDYYKYVLLDQSIIINHENYSKINNLNTKQFNNIYNQLFNEGILFQQGDRWKQQTELFSLHFDCNKLKISLNNINQIIEKYIILYDEQQENIYEMILKTINQIIVFSFFGVDADKLQINRRCMGLETINYFKVY